MASTILVTGTAGFIGFHTALQLMNRGDTVVGIDNVNDYYDVALKLARLAALERAAKSTAGSFIDLRVDVSNTDAVNKAFETHKPDYVIHLAAQPGVQYSLKNPMAYIEANIVGFANILEACRHHPVKHLTFASSSSIYGANQAMPFSEHHGTAHPLQLYAATKRSNELMAHSYAHLYNIPVTGLRFFTVYGPWGRPDMAPFIFTKNIIEEKPIKVFNYGNHSRDFTYIDDIVEGVIRTSDLPAEPDPNWDPMNPDPATSSAPYRLFNIGCTQPVKLIDFISAIEEATGKEAIKDLQPQQPGDVPDTFSDTSELVKATGYKPQTELRTGVKRFVDWYRDYYQV